MNKRDKQAKKWIKRFITPLVSDIPETIWGCHRQELYGNDIEDDVNMTKEFIVIGTNHTIINGCIVPEGNRPYYLRSTLFENIKRTASKVEEVIRTHKYPHLRMIDIRVNSIRVRIITE